MSSSRLPPQKPRSALEGEQKDFSDRLDEMLPQRAGAEFTIVTKEDTFAGPFQIFIQMGTKAIPFFGMVQGLARMKGLSEKARETAILVTGTLYNSAYENYAHERIAERVGLTDKEIQEIRKMNKPDTLDASCSIAFEVAEALQKHRGPLRQDLYDKAMEVLGLEGTVALIQFCGFYAYISVILNGHDIPVPEDKK